MEYELGGVSRKEALVFDETWLKARGTPTAEKGYMEASGWIRNAFPDQEKVMKLIKDRMPVLYEQLFPPATPLSPQMEQIRQKLLGESVGQALSAYLGKHPEITGVFWGRGGSTIVRRNMHPHESKYLGLMLWNNQWDVNNGMSSFPSDVWQLVETKTTEPLAFIDKLRVTDPEGTHLEADLTQEQARKWARGVYQRGHLFMYPTMASAKFAYSVVDYPAFQREWIPPEPMVLVNGVVAGNQGHGGFYPRIEVHYKNGYISDIKGGGIYGEIYREFLKYPKINELPYPFFTHAGYFYLHEISLGTNPKAIRDPYYLHAEGGSTSPERNRSGVFHIASGRRVSHSPTSPTLPKEWVEFTKLHNLPNDHGFHIHNYFATYEVRLRGANRWVTLVDKGHLTSLDDPEVRALASRYGDPDKILSEDWVPGIPGINAPGRYEDYAKDPWKFAKAEMAKIMAGTYEYFYPPVKSGK